MKKLIIFTTIPEEIPEGFSSIGININDDSIYETLLKKPTGSRLAVASDMIGLSVYEIRKNKINKIRDEAIASGVEFDGNIYDSSVESSNKIIAAATMAGGNSAFKINWITEDNQIVELTLEKLMQLGMTIMQVSSAEHLKARALKDALPEEIFALFTASTES